MKRVSLLIPLAAAILLCTAPAQAQRIAIDEASAAGFLSNARATSPALRHAEGLSARSFTLLADQAERMLSRTGTFTLNDFPVSVDSYGNVTLKRVRSTVDATTEVWAEGRDGSVRVPTPEVLSFRGFIDGEEGSSVFLSYSSGHLFCSIRRDNGESFVLAPATGKGSADEHVITAANAMSADAIESTFDCFAQAPPRGDVRDVKDAEPLRRINAAKTLLQVNVAVEADYNYFRNLGRDRNAVLAYTTALYDMVSVIYEDEVGVTFHIPWVKMWEDSTTDPYKVAGNAYALWDKVPNYWKANYADVNRNLAHVMTSVDYGGGGKAYRGEKFEGGSAVICSKEYGYGMSSPTCGQEYPTFRFTYDVYIVAHEIGHNFGARHTHDCWWAPPLDTCFTKDDAALALSDACHAKPITPQRNSGSLMSYCASANYTLSGNNFNEFKLDMTFLPRVAAVLRQEAEASCLEEPTDPRVILTSPRGGTKYGTPGDLQITWLSAKVDNVKLSYSTDGAEWKEIIASMPASAGEYTWTMPSMTASEVRVRVSDVSNAERSDESIFTFETAASVAGGSDARGAATLDVTLDAGSAVQVRYAAPSASGSLKLYDMLGNLVRTIRPAGQVAAAGESFMLPTSDLANGTYFVALETGSTRIARSFSIAR